MAKSLSSQSAPTRRVLLVDDEQAILQVLKGMLEFDGLGVTTAVSGEEALERLRASAFDLLITDKNLPGVDGVELAHGARQMDPRIGIVLMTGYGSVESAQAVLGVVDAYFTKPFDLRTFRRSLLTILEHRCQPPPQEPPEPRPGSPRVLLIHPDARQRSRLASLLRGLRLEVQEGEVVDLELGSDALVIDTAACGHELVQAIWRRKGTQRNFPVVAVSRTASLDDSTKAISLLAGAHLLSSASDEQLSEALRRGLIPGEASHSSAAAPLSAAR